MKFIQISYTKKKKKTRETSFWRFLRQVQTFLVSSSSRINYSHDQPQNDHTARSKVAEKNWGPDTMATWYILREIQGYWWTETLNIFLFIFKKNEINPLWSVGVKSKNLRFNIIIKNLNIFNIVFIFKNKYNINSLENIDQYTRACVCVCVCNKEW